MSLRKLFSATNVVQLSPTRVVGVDVGSSSIKVVELENRNNVVTLTTYGELQLGPYDGEKSIGQSVILNPSTERQALVDVLRESAVKARSAVLAMPLSSSFVTIMNLEATPDEDITPRVHVEARKHIPVPIAEVTLDWAEVDTSEEASAHSRDVLLAAIQNEALKRFTTLMQTVNFNNAPTEIECFSTIRGIYSADDEEVAIIDMGATLTKLYVVRGGLLQRMYRVRAGGAECTAKISTEQDITFEEAELLKRSVARDDEKFPTLQKIHHNHFNRVLKEFKQVLNDYETKIDTEISVIYLTGGTVLFPGMDTFIANQLEREVRISNSFNKVAYPAFMEDTMKEIGPSFTVALGAALRSFE